MLEDDHASSLAEEVSSIEMEMVSEREYASPSIASSSPHEKHADGEMFPLHGGPLVL